jgi:hypothetical protein
LGTRGRHLELGTTVRQRQGSERGAPSSSSSGDRAFSFGPNSAEPTPTTKPPTVYAIEFHNGAVILKALRFAGRGRFMLWMEGSPREIVGSMPDLEQRQWALSSSATPSQSPKSPKSPNSNSHPAVSMSESHNSAPIAISFIFFIL